jgi:metal-responsive CopG/Arc/MetJ family transcriptional regulator
LVEEIEIIAKKQGISRSRLIESIIENFLSNQPNHKPRTAKEKVIHWLLTGDESVFK